MNGKLVVISSSEIPAAFPVTGVIQLRDQSGNTITSSGVIIKESGTVNSTVTNDLGEFTLNVADGNARLEVSHGL